MKRGYSTVELFAGSGGLALGLEMAGFEMKAAIENNKWAIKTLQFNRPSWHIIGADIEDVVEAGIYKYLDSGIEVDLLSGGYPCQSFSYAGNRLGFADTRGTLFSSYAKILEELRPKMFLVENVKGLSTHDNGNTLQTMLDTFERSGYMTSYQVLNALHYGVSQKRHRIFIIGVRNDVQSRVGRGYTFPDPLETRLTLRDVLQDVPESKCAAYNDKKKEVMRQVSPGGCWRDLPDDVARLYMKSTYFMGGGEQVLLESYLGTSLV